MALKTINDTNLSAIAAAIREKNQTTTTYKPSEMAEAIKAISTGGSKYKKTGYFSFTNSKSYYVGNIPVPDVITSPDQIYSVTCKVLGGSTILVNNPDIWQHPIMVMGTQNPSVILADGTIVDTGNPATLAIESNTLKIKLSNGSEYSCLPGGSTSYITYGYND